jgi:hypothetical protein
MPPRRSQKGGTQAKSKAKKARVVAEDEEEFDCSESEEKEEENIPYIDRDGSGDHVADDVDNAE